MKKNFKILISAVAIALTAFLFTACKKDKQVDLVKKTSATLGGAYEAPPIASTGTGSIDVAYNTASKVITYTVIWQLGLASDTTVAMHFHGAADGSDSKSSPVTIGVTGFSSASSGSLSGATRALSQAEEDQLLGNKWYFNIHSSTTPSGELRGNIKFSGNVTNNGGY